MKKTLYASFLLSALATQQLACGSGNASQQDDKNSEVTPPASDERGVTVTKYDPNATTPQTFQASSSSAIAEAAMTIQPGSLAVDVNVTIEEGAPIVGESSEANLGLGATTIEAAGPAVAITASQVIDATKPFTLALPIDTGASLMQGGKGNITIVYKVSKGKDNGGISIGVFPTADITVEGNIARVNTTWFGVYQVAYASAPITEIKEVRTETPLIVKSKSTDLTGRWLEACRNRTYQNQDGTEEEESETQLLTFSHDRINIKVTNYGGEDCKTPTLTFELGATYATGEASAKVPGAKHLDLTITRGLMTVVNADAVTRANNPQQPLCGFTDWKLNEPRAISDFKVCGGDDSSGNQTKCNDGPPAFNQPYYTIYSVVGDKLRLGKDEAPNCGNTPQTRNTTLDNNILTKILP